MTIKNKYTKCIKKIWNKIFGNEMNYPNSSVMKGLDALQEEWDFYQKKRNELLKKHENMYVAIKGKEILGIQEKLSELERIVYENHPELESQPVLFQKIEIEPTIYYMRKPRF